MSFSQQGLGAEVDETDLNIIKQLSQNAKMSFADLGKKIHLTAPAVHARVKKLEKAGIIKNYSAEIDFKKIGMPVTAFVRIQTGKQRCSEVGKQLMKYPEIEECHSVAGEDDLVLKTRTATPLELQNLLDRMRVQGISEKSISIFVLQTHFERSRV